jgi:hypothetical protein
MTMPSFTADASLSRGRGFYGTGHQVPAAGTAEALAPQGFGCPDDGPCNTHCQSTGHRGGYCGDFLWQVCTCY